MPPRPIVTAGMPRLIGAFESVLERQDPREIETVRREIETRLDALEGERFL